VVKKVLGIDIGAKFVVGFYLESPPPPPYPKWYRGHSRGRVFKLKMQNHKKKKGDNRPDGVNLNEAIDLIQELAPDVIVMEPTGVWYSKIWAEIARQLSIEVKWIGHQDLAARRVAYGFTDKDDRTDAFSLALTYYDPAFGDDRWIEWRSSLADDIHQRILEIKAIETLTNPAINQLRQRLKYEFPEIADRCNKIGVNGYAPWIGWLAGIQTYKLIENEYDRSIARQLSIEISDFTRQQASRITGMQIHKTQLEAELIELFKSPELTPYIKIMDKIGFGVHVKAAVLSNIYPFEKFLEDGKPAIERWIDDSGRHHKRDRSKAAFQLSLGMGKRLIESGSTSHWEYAGSGLCRKMLHCWAVGQVLTQHDSDKWIVTELDRKANLPAQPNNNQPRAKTVAKLYHDWRSVKGGNLQKHKACIRSSMNICHRVAKIFYDELRHELDNNP
jgi:hypothetical protein